jgi:hypothetical protein
MTIRQLLLGLVILTWTASPVAAQALSPKQAAAKVGEKVTVEFLVQSTGYNQAGFWELYSEKNWDHPNNFFIRFPEKVWGKFRKLGLFKPENHFENKTLRVTGKVTLLQFGDARGKWPVIYVDDLDQVEVLAPKYHTQQLDGFNVFINEELLAHPSEAAPALRELKKQLAAIVRSVPKKPLQALREVPIRLERDEKKHAAYYSWGSWHKGKNPQFNDGLVVLANARLFVDWSQHGQPCMVLHELAHAYHHRVLGEHHAGITTAYDQAMMRKLYESVPYVLGGKKKAYATTNEREYFAELTEAYFGKNDFYPYTRADLKEHDPAGFQLMVQVWEK